jgi:hypothetical protein
MPLNLEKITQRLKDNKNTLNDIELHNVGGLGSSMHGFFQEESTDQKAAKKLLSHVVRGEQDEAKEMIAANPGLLLIQTEAENNSGRTIQGTAFQAALGAEDEHMWQMMMPYMDDKTMRDQFDEQFPDGIEDIPASDLQPYYDDLLSTIIWNYHGGLSAIDAFRVKITQNNHITSGKHFNMQHLVAACQAYIDFYRKFDSDEPLIMTEEGEGLERFWNRVVGYIQRQMPANYAPNLSTSFPQSIWDINSLEKEVNDYVKQKHQSLQTLSSSLSTNKCPIQ